MSERRPFRYWLERMAAHGFTPSRRLGQNFLLDQSLHHALAVALAPGPRDVVLEVGPGLGFLTRELLALAGSVVAVEIDPRLFAILKEELGAECWPGGRLRLHPGNILAKDALDPQVLEIVASAWVPGGRFLVAANLPYAISGPFLAQLPVLERPPAVAILLVQQELAERLSGKDAGADGALATLLQAAYQVRIVRRVGREVFRPRPKVDSAVLELTALSDGILTRPVDQRLRLRRFFRELFLHRRKQIRSTLKAAAAALGLADPAHSEGLPLGARAEDLGVVDLIALFDRLARS